MSDRTCSVDGCGKAYRAKGLCSTHYNQQMLAPGERHKLRPRECTVCGKPLIRLPRGKIRPTCSPECRTILQHGQIGIGGYDRDRTATLRARKAGATGIDLVSHIEVFERDNWTCYLCMQPVDRDANCYQLNSATADHVIPLSQGGSHTLQNMRLACLDCNSRKGEYTDKIA